LGIEFRPEIILLRHLIFDLDAGLLPELRQHRNQGIRHRMRGEVDIDLRALFLSPVEVLGEGVSRQRAHDGDGAEH
jgi:hypothetical protein